MKELVKIAALFVFAVVITTIVFWQSPPSNYTVEALQPFDFVMDETTDIAFNSGSCQLTATVYLDSGKNDAVIGLVRSQPSVGNDTITLQPQTLDRGVPGTLYKAVEEMQTGDRLTNDGQFEIQVHIEGECRIAVIYDYLAAKVASIILTFVILALIISMIELRKEQE